MLMHVIYTVNLYSSVLILAFISLDRYLPVVRATDNRSTRKLLASRVIYLGVWLPAAILTIPDLVFARVQDVQNHIPVGFVLPGLVILVCYFIIISSLSRGAKGQVLKKSKALMKTVILVLCFFNCWLPYCLSIFVDTMLNAVSSSCEVQQAMETWISVMEALAYFHCCLNPILYAFLGVKFNQTPRSTLAIIISGSQKAAPLTNKQGQISSVSTESKSSGVLSS
ncbi:hypothetical protein CRENBAI_010694 [Crenichthys baileyi]|uniref:G-protein coupled receptors family 1 profile domain-containing protein n=1 Tax=Crenichthys baileyi TaxID=28760 RepID=A0AAV9RYJ2_9TELE